MIYLVNAPKRGATKRRGKAASKKRTKAKARRSTSPFSKTRRKGAQMAAKKRRKRRVTARRASPRRKRRVTTRKPGITVKRRGQVVYQGNPRRRRKASSRRYRRNPGGGILSTVMRTGQDALAILGGMAVTNLIARRIPFGEGNKAVEVAKKIAVAIGLGMVAQKAVSRSMAEKITIGGMVAVGADLLRNVPMVGTALAGDDDLRMLARSGMGSYPLPLLESQGLAAWPQPGVEQAGGLASYYN